jgi:signal peptidase I
MRGYWEGIQLGPHEYLALGDNGPSSSDGRAWGYVPEKNLMGQAFAVFWPGLPWNFRWKFIR